MTPGSPATADSWSGRPPARRHPRSLSSVPPHSLGRPGPCGLAGRSCPHPWLRLTRSQDRPLSGSPPDLRVTHRQEETHRTPRAVVIREGPRSPWSSAGQEVPVGRGRVTNGPNVTSDGRQDGCPETSTGEVPTPTETSFLRSVVPGGAVGRGPTRLAGRTPTGERTEKKDGRPLRTTRDGKDS